MNNALQPFKIIQNYKELETLTKSQNIFKAHPFDCAHPQPQVDLQILRIVHLIIALNPYNKTNSSQQQQQQQLQQKNLIPLGKVVYMDGATTPLCTIRNQSFRYIVN